MDIPLWLKWAQGLLTVCAGVVAATWGIARWYRRPKIIIGVPPSTSEREAKYISENKLGAKKVVTQFEYSDECLAYEITQSRKMKLEEDSYIFNDKFKCRNISVSENKVILGVIVYNNGYRAAMDFYLAIYFYEPKIHVSEVVFETFELDSFYPEEIRSVKSETLSNKMADERIVGCYDDHLDWDENWGDILFIKGDIPGSDCELIFIELEIQPSIDRFKIGFAFDCPNEITKRQYFIQGIILNREADNK